MIHVLADVLLRRVCVTETVTPDQGALSPESAAEQSAPGRACFCSCVPGHGRRPGSESPPRRMSRILGACGRRLASAAWPDPCPAHTDRNGSRVVPLFLHIVPVLVHGTITVSTRRPVVRNARASAALPTASVRQQAQRYRANPSRSCPALAHIRRITRFCGALHISVSPLGNSGRAHHIPAGIGLASALTIEDPPSRRAAAPRTAPRTAARPREPRMNRAKRSSGTHRMGLRRPQCAATGTRLSAAGRRPASDGSALSACATTARRWAIICSRYSGRWRARSTFALRYSSTLPAS